MAILIILRTEDHRAAIVRRILPILMLRFAFLPLFNCRVDTRRYESAYHGGRSYDDNSFAGAHLKDIQWDMNQLIKFEKNFYHVQFVPSLLPRNTPPSRRCPTLKWSSGVMTTKSFVKAKTFPSPFYLSMFHPSLVLSLSFSSFLIPSRCSRCDSPSRLQSPHSHPIAGLAHGSFRSRRGRHCRYWLGQNLGVHSPRHHPHPRPAHAAPGRRSDLFGAVPHARAGQSDAGGVRTVRNLERNSEHLRVWRRAAPAASLRSASRRGDRDCDAGPFAGLLGVGRDEPAPRDVSGDGRSRPHARHGIRAADPKDRLADPTGSADFDVVCDLAEGSAGPGSRFPDESDPGEHWLAGLEGDRPREAGDQMRDGGAEAGRNAEDPAVQEPRIALYHLHPVQARRGRADAHSAAARIQRVGDPRR